MCAPSPFGGLVAQEGGGIMGGVFFSRTGLWKILQGILHRPDCIYRITGNESMVRTMKISARNMLKGTVKAITPGAVNSEIVIELPGGQLITSIITKKSVESLGLAPGKVAYAVIKSSEVMVAVD